MSSTLEANFKSVGASQMISDFKTVGTAAGGASRGISQASTASQGLGKTMKSSAAGIGQVATAFAALSLSIVNTYRSYRDLNDAQLQVDKATKKVHATELAIKNLKADIAKETKAQSKGGLDYALVQAKIDKMQQDFNKHQKDGKHTAADLKLEYLQIQKVMKDGVKGTGDLTQKEEKLKLLEEGLSNSKEGLTQAQKRFNDSQQDFYLSLAPTAIATIGTLTSAFSGFKGVLTGGGGLVGALGPIGIGLTAISLGILAFKTNFLGLRDAASGVINWFKSQFGAWKDTVQKVFDLIRKGDWNGAFNTIRSAAEKFWHNLATTVPFFGVIDRVIGKIRAGDWSGAFKVIQTAAVQFWNYLKANVPFLADIEVVIRDIMKGDWKGAFDKIVNTAKAAFNNIFGANASLQTEGFFRAIQSDAGMAISAIKNGDWKGAFGAINDGLKNSGAQQAIDKLLKPQINLAADIVDQLAGGAATLITGFATVINDSVNSGIDVVDWPALSTRMVTAFVMGVGAAMLVNFRTAFTKFLAAELKLASTGPQLQTAAANVGIAIYNAMVDELFTLITTSPFFPLDAFTKVFPQLKDALNKGIQNLHVDPIKMPPPDKTDFDAKAKKTIDDVIKDISARGNAKPIELPPVKFTADSTDVQAKVNEAARNIKAKIPLLTRTTMQGIDKASGVAQNVKRALANIPRTVTTTFRVQGDLRAAAGFNAGVHIGHAGGGTFTIRQPTAMIVGEGGREEQVSITPRGSSGHSGDSGGNGDIYVGPIYLDGEKVQDTMRLKMNRFQGTFK